MNTENSKIKRTSLNDYHNIITINAGLRFVHLIVDGVIFTIISHLIGAIPAINESLLQILNLISILIYPFVYAFMEYKFQQTPGKMITGYVVINLI